MKPTCPDHPKCRFCGAELRYESRVTNTCILGTIHCPNEAEHPEQKDFVEDALKALDHFNCVDGRGTPLCMYRIEEYGPA